MVGLIQKVILVVCNIWFGFIISDDNFLAPSFSEIPTETNVMDAGFVSTKVFGDVKAKVLDTAKFCGFHRICDFTGCVRVQFDYLISRSLIRHDLK